MPNYLKRIKIITSVILLMIICVFLNSSNAYAHENKYVVLGGEAIGLKIETGVFVAGKYQVNGKNSKFSPWKNSDLEEGDAILEFNGAKVQYTTELISLVKKSDVNVGTLKIKRDNKIFNTNIDIVETINGEQTIGLYLKDRLIGIGTLTFYDPETLAFASLGHGINDKSITYGNVNGNVVTTSIQGIKKGISGQCGEKRALLKNNIVGTITKNNLTGVYGKLSSPLSKDQIKVARQDEIKKGKAQILTVIKEDKIEAFDIEILSINIQDSIQAKGIKFKVTDELLISQTGGIVQGMSGSPIIQNNMLIGAVSHVSIEDPKIGYGMHIEWMVDETSKM